MFGFETFWQKFIGEKRVRKMLMKLTPESNAEGCKNVSVGEQSMVEMSRSCC
jgi:hypothetical protein